MSPPERRFAKNTQQAGDGANRPVFVVLGMHRSGTSTVARALEALGVSLGDNLMPPAAGNNERGFFEDLDIYRLNERLLNRAGSVWHKLAPLDPVAMTGPAFSSERREASTLLAQKMQAEPFGFKDPRLSVLLPFWQCIFEDLDLAPTFIIVVRNPFEVATSLEARDGMPLAKGIALWAKHTIEALRHTQGKRRVFIAYDRLLSDPLSELQRLAIATALPEPIADSEETRTFCEEFLTTDLRHNRISANELKRSGLAPEFVSELYSIVSALAAEAPYSNQDIDTQQWNEIAARYNELAPLFAYADRLDDDRAGLRRQLEEAKKQAREASELAQQTASQRDAAEQALRVANAEHDRLNSELATQAGASEEERLRLVATLETSEHANQAQQTRITQFAQSQQAAEIEIARLTAALDEQRNNVDAERLERLSLESKHARTTAEFEDASAKIQEAVEQERAAARAHAKAIEVQLTSASALLKQVRAEREDLATISADRAHEIVQLEQEKATLAQRFQDARRDLLLTRAALTETRRSTSWRLTAPVRGVVSLLRDPVGGTRSMARAILRAAWRRLPMPAEQRGRLAARMFATAPALFSWSRAYKAWAAQPAADASTGRTEAPDQDEYTEPSSDPALEGYVPLLATTAPQSVSARAIAFYLPQFHPIPENDHWWGDGFTEWTKVKAAEPRFRGHYQPHEPGELGYYDLVKDDGVMKRQAELAKLHGVGGFCFYFYWFGGKRLLETPIQKFHNDRSIDLPFCLCWANENWTRRWDGKANEILIAQNHSAEDDIDFIKHVSQYFSDPRYIRIDGRPLLIVYRPALLPSAKETVERWRRWLRNNGFGEVYLAYTQSFESEPPSHYGLDAAIEFAPNNMGLVSKPELVDTAGELSIYDWRDLRSRAKQYTKPSYPLFRGVSPQWDNTPRRPADGAVFVHTSPSAFASWLADAVRDTVSRFANPQERLIFINAWNEWAEGAHLEPDLKYGYAWLEATRRALDPDAGRRKVIVVTHDLHRHGAQFLALNLVHTLRRRFGLDVVTITGQTGELKAAFKAEAPLLTLDPRATDDSALTALAARGFRHAIVNSAASGWIASKLAKSGIKMIGLVHELPSVIEQLKLAPNLAALDRHAEALVFPAATVRDKDIKAAGVNAWRNPQIMPQGLYKAQTILRLEQKDEARGRILPRLGLPEDSRIVLGAGYADARKGVDTFIAWATAASERWPHAHFVWIGATAPELKDKISSWLASAGAQRQNIHLLGFQEQTSDFYAAADVYALCSREDPFPSTALEAFAAATPVITIQGTGGIENLEAHGCVKPIASAEPAAFVIAAAEWLENQYSARAAGERGRNLVREQFGFVSYAGALLDKLDLGVPNISVVVPNYNYARHLEQRLQTILDQTLAPREILFLDDASSDDSVAVAQRVLSGSPINWRVLRNTRNSGDVFGQWRKGVEMAQGDLVWIAEADDWADPRFLEAAARPFARSDVVLSMTQSHQAGEDGRILASDYLDYVRDVSADKWKRAFVGNGRAEIQEGLSVKNTIPNVSAVLFRRSALLGVLSAYARDIGGYRVAGDWCVYVNLLRHGHLAYSPASLNFHRRHDTSVTISKFGLAELAEIARMQAYIGREFGYSAEYAARARAYLECLVRQYGLDQRWPPAQIEGAMRGVVAA